jgi:hypothetical protein
MEVGSPRPVSVPAFPRAPARCCAGILGWRRRAHVHVDGGGIKQDRLLNYPQGLARYENVAFGRTGPVDRLMAVKQLLLRGEPTERGAVHMCFFDSVPGQRPRPAM